ncbi:MAG: DUF3310 domain-containing protein [Tepidisphaeraceae bacterium]
MAPPDDTEKRLLRAAQLDQQAALAHLPWCKNGRKCTLPDQHEGPCRPHPDQQEQVNHPGHYGGDTTYETIKVLAAWGLGFLLGNTVKYISRAGKKGDPSKLLEDLKKGRWYLDQAIQRIERNEPLF